MSFNSMNAQSFTTPGEDLKYNGNNHGKVVVYFMGQIQICYPAIYLWLTTGQLPRDSPHHPKCWFDAGADCKDAAETPESPNVGIIMVNSEADPVTSASSSNSQTAAASSSSSSSSSSKATSNRRESGGHALFGNLGGIDLDSTAKDGSGPVVNAAYFDKDPFGHARCKIKCSDARTVAEKELEFGSAMRAACACMLLCYTPSIKNKLLTNLDFRHASSVGRIDVMLLIMRVLDSNHFSSTIRKNMLNTFSFPILLDFLKINQGGDSLATFTKRFNDKLLGLNTLGAMVSDTAPVQLLLNNLWGQLYLFGLNESYARLKCNACEKDDLDFPKTELEHIQATSRVWEESIIRRRKLMGKSGGGVDVKANVATVDSDDEYEGQSKKSSKAVKKTWTREEKDEQVKVAVAAAHKSAKVRYDQLKSTHQSKIKSMDTKKNAYCFLCGYNKGHNSHLCERIPGNLKADALKEFERQSAWLASNSKK
jgi:hypothetical protein